MARPKMTKRPIRDKVHGSWRYTEERGIEAEIAISCLGVTLPLREVYERVDFRSPVNPGS